jgi:hypothetical protein
MRGLMNEKYGLGNELQGSTSQNLAGKASLMQQQFFRMNGMEWWTTKMKTASSLGLTNYLGGSILDGVKFKDLHANTQQLLEAYNFTSKDWDFLHKSKLDIVEDRHYLSLESIAKIPEGEWRKHLSLDPETHDYSNKLKMGKEDLLNRYRGFIMQESSKAAGHPGAHEASFLRQGTQPGTPMGELARMIGQFKSFPITMINTFLNTNTYSHGGGANILDAMANGATDKLAMASTIVMMSVMGYLSMTVKDTLKGRDPRELSPETITAAMLQGGALGIYGDILLSDRSKYGTDFVSSLAGPVAGLANDMVQIASSGQRQEDGSIDFSNTPGVALKRTVGHIPFANLFYTKPFLDFLIINRAQEAINPGYLRRIKQQIKSDQH